MQCEKRAILLRNIHSYMSMHVLVIYTYVMLVDIYIFFIFMSILTCMPTLFKQLVCTPIAMMEVN